MSRRWRRFFRSVVRATALLAASVGIASVAAAQTREPAPVQRTESITVTATRELLALTEIASPAVVLSGEQLRQRPALGLDEALRWNPELSLLRRAPARGSHPTAQGLNVRGVAPSGTSRALVLLDGVPFTDAFGGWVTWSRIPALAIERVEIVRGGGAGSYGNQALAGTVQILLQRPTDRAPRFDAETRLGNTGIVGASALASSPTLAGGALVALEAFRTSGYFAVERSARGAVDAPIATRHVSVLATATPTAGLHVAVDTFSETRRNGTAEQTNDTRGVGVRGRYEHAGSARAVQAVGSLRRHVFRSRFSALAPDRSSEVAVLAQRVPSLDAAAAVNSWWRIGGRSSLAAGADGRAVWGRSEEDVLIPGIRREPGGRQLLGGAHVAWRTRPVDTLSVEASARADHWSNRPREAGPTSRTATTFSPRVGGAWQFGAGLIARAAAYRSFRAPTLNELYRQFRVGNVQTAANPALTHERLRGIEAGAAGVWRIGETLRVDAGGTVYWNRLDDAVVNATVGTTPSLVLRQRRNIGRSEVRGVEIDAAVVGRQWRIAASGRWMHSEILASDGGADEIGRRLPQVPSRRLSLVATLQGNSWMALVGVHAVGHQFEDDRNELELEAATTIDGALEWQLSPAVTVAAHVQDLFDQRPQVGRTPVLLLAPPRSLSIGVRFSPAR